jgi:uncharacterized protein
MQFEQAGNYILNKLSEDLPTNLYYHNAEHANDVYDACKLLAQQERIDAYNTKLLLTAALYHDSGFLNRSYENELISCEIARQTLPNYDYTVNEIDQICGMIMATRLPQTPKNHLEEILADADLDYLGREDFFFVSNKLYLELFALGKVTSAENWVQMQVGFMENHSYFTESSRQLRQPKKEDHLKQLKAKLKMEI